jgi:hypothetical protein
MRHDPTVIIFRLVLPIATDQPGRAPALHDAPDGHVSLDGVVGSLRGVPHAGCAASRCRPCARMFVGGFLRIIDAKSPMSRRGDQRKGRADHAVEVARHAGIRLERRAPGSTWASADRRRVCIGRYRVSIGSGNG